ncbi:MAG: hypothetical protein INR72_15220 [Williamsia herbipolensis]|nr:hypothetical protein [Williamsia herbipolensis]
MSRHRRPTRWSTRVGTALLAATALVVWIGARGTVSGFAAALVKNTADTAQSALLSVTNTITSPAGTCTGSSTSTAIVQCPSSTLPASVTTGTTSVQDTITNTGTVAAANVRSQHRIATCGAVQLANSVTGGSSGSMLVRTGTTFAPTGGPSGLGAITLNGTTGYASSVRATSEPAGAALLGAQYGLGIYFKTSDATGIEPILGFGTDATATIGTTNDRILYLNGGKIGFVAKTGTGGLTLGPAAPSAMSAPYYGDGKWHFAYVLVQTALLTLANTVSVYVDGTLVTSQTMGLLATLNSYSGYWHLGWSPVGGTGRFFNGSLSDFVVDDSGSAPNVPANNPTDYTSFDSSRTQQWPMNDSGGTFDGTTATGIYTGASFPAGGDPCAAVDMTWTVGGSAVGGANATLAARVGTYLPAAPGVTLSATQTATLALTRDTGNYNAYDSGLILYAPVQSTYTVYSGQTATSWTVSFLWSGGVGTGTVVLA